MNRLSTLLAPLAGLALIAAPVAVATPAAHATEPPPSGDIVLDRHEYRQASKVRDALARQGVRATVAEAPAGLVDIERTPLVRVFDHETAAELRRFGSNHLYGSTITPLGCPGPWSLVMTPPEGGVATFPTAWIPDGSVVLVPRPQDGDPAVAALLITTPEVATCLSS